MSGDQSEREQLAGWFRGAIQQARNGNKEMADSLLRQFAKLASCPYAYDSVGGAPIELLQYVAACIEDWQKRSYRNAETCFKVQRPDHRPRQAISHDDLRALRAYWVMRARGRGTFSALEFASNYSGLTEDRARYLVESHPERDDLRVTVRFMVSRRVAARLKATLPRKKYQRRG